MKKDNLKEKTNNIGICKLCLKEKVLVDSHIFPEFMYKPLYDEKGKFKILSSQIKGVEKEPRKGIYEKLLCAECDNTIIGNYENYASKILFGDGKKENVFRTTEYGIEYLEVDYTLFKLFQISLLWRASITSRSEMNRINLGPHAEIMREMLLSSEPAEPYQYGAIIFFTEELKEVQREIIVGPSLLPKRIEGHRIYRAIFNGLIWSYFISRHTYSFSKKEFFLQKDGTLPFVNAGKLGGDLFYNTFSEFFKLGN